MIKIISNKYFLFTLLFLYNCVAFAHDCSSPGDCEKTAGYNAALAITGGVIALGAGLISTWMPPEVPEVPENDFENEFGEEFDDEFDEGFSDEFDEGNEDKFDEDDSEENGDVDEEENREDEYDDDGGEGEDENKDEDEGESNKDDESDKGDDVKDLKDKSTKSPKEDKKGFIDTLEDISSKIEATDFLDPSQKLTDNLNNIKTLIVDSGDAGLQISKGAIKLKSFFGFEKIENAALKFTNFVSKNKTLTNFAGKIGSKIESIAKSDLYKAAISKAEGFKKYIGSSMKHFGHLADGLTFLNNLNKKIGGGHADWLTTGVAVGEETLRFGIKTVLTKTNPAIAVGDAVLSLAGGPNLDKVIDVSIDTIEQGTSKGVSKVTKWVYSDHKSAYIKLNKDYDIQKKRIDEMHLSPSEKGKKLRKVWKILKKTHGISFEKH